MLLIRTHYLPDNIDYMIPYAFDVLCLFLDVLNFYLRHVHVYKIFLCTNHEQNQSGLMVSIY